MTPREFYGVTGPVSLKTLALVDMSGAVVGENRDRYLLCIYCNDSVSVFPAFSEGPGIGGFFVSASNPYIVTHALHGTLVGEPHLINVPLPPVNVAIVEGFLFAPKPRILLPERGPDEKFIQELRGTDHGSIDANSRTKSPPSAVGYLSPNRRRNKP